MPVYHAAVCSAGVHLGTGWMEALGEKETDLLLLLLDFFFIDDGLLLLMGSAEGVIRPSQQKSKSRRLRFLRGSERGSGACISCSSGEIDLGSGISIDTAE